MKQVIYIAGDSFTAGEDIGDFLVPNAVSRTRNDFNDHLMENVQSWQKYRDTWLHQDPNHIKQFTDFNVQNRWSTQLSQILDISVINNSIGGSSNYEIMYKTLHDILDLQSQGIEIKDVIVQTTSSDRYSYYCKNSSSPDIENHKKYLISSFSRHSKKNNLYTSDYYSRETWEMSAYRYFVDLMFFDNTITNILGKKPIYVDSVFLKKNSLLSEYMHLVIDNNFLVGRKQKHLVSKQILEFAKDFVNRRIELAMDDELTFDEAVWTTNFHLNSSVHKRFAQRIAERYYNVTSSS